MEEDRKFILASAAELEQYLSSSVVLWPLRGNKAPLSPGNLLFAQSRLNATTADGELIGNLERIKVIIDTNRSAWRRRVEKEIPLRLNQYRSLVDDYLDVGTIDAGYRNNISTRVKLDLLLSALDAEPVANLQVIAELDRKLFSLLCEGKFIWEDALGDLFTKDRYSFLYVEGK